MTALRADNPDPSLALAVQPLRAAAGLGMAPPLLQPVQSRFLYDLLPAFGLLASLGPPFWGSPTPTLPLREQLRGPRMTSCLARAGLLRWHVLSTSRPARNWCVRRARTPCPAPVCLHRWRLHSLAAPSAGILHDRRDLQRALTPGVTIP